MPGPEQDLELLPSPSCANLRGLSGHPFSSTGPSCFIRARALYLGLPRNAYRQQTVPTLQLHGMRDVAVDHRRRAVWREFSDEMALELREDSGHFIAKELPGARGPAGAGTVRQLTAGGPSDKRALAAVNLRERSKVGDA